MPAKPGAAAHAAVASPSPAAATISRRDQVGAAAWFVSFMAVSDQLSGDPGQHGNGAARRPTRTCRCRREPAVRLRPRQLGTGAGGGSVGDGSTGGGSGTGGARRCTRSTSDVIAT